MLLVLFGYLFVNIVPVEFMKINEVAKNYFWKSGRRQEELVVQITSKVHASG